MLGSLEWCMADHDVLGCTVAALTPKHAYLCAHCYREREREFQHPHILRKEAQVIMRDRRYDSILIVRIECVAAASNSFPFPLIPTQFACRGNRLPTYTPIIQCDMRYTIQEQQLGSWHRLLLMLLLLLLLLAVCWMEFHLAGDARSREFVDSRS